MQQRSAAQCGGTGGCGGMVPVKDSPLGEGQREGIKEGLRKKQGQKRKEGTSRHRLNCVIQTILLMNHISFSYCFCS